MEGTRNLSVGSESQRACLDSEKGGENDIGLEQFKQDVIRI